MAVDPVTAISSAIKEGFELLELLFNGKNRELLQDVKQVKNMKKALDVAQELFLLVDPHHFPKEHYAKYWKLRSKFNKFD